MKMAVDDANGIMCLQWVDSKVVQVVTTKVNTSVGEVLRQQGSQKQRIPGPEAIMHYHPHVYGVDKGDQIRAHGGGFLIKAQERHLCHTRYDTDELLNQLEHGGNRQSPTK